MTEPVRKTIMESPIQSIMMLALVGLMGWVAMTTQQLSLDVAVQAESIKGIQSQLSSAAEDRYTGAQAKSFEVMTNQRFKYLENAVDDLSKRLNDIDDDPR